MQGREKKHQRGGRKGTINDRNPMQNRARIKPHLLINNKTHTQGKQQPSIDLHKGVEKETLTRREDDRTRGITRTQQVPAVTGTVAEGRGGCISEEENKAITHGNLIPIRLTTGTTSSLTTKTNLTTTTKLLGGSLDKAKLALRRVEEPRLRDLTCFRLSPQAIETGEKRSGEPVDGRATNPNGHNFHEPSLDLHHLCEGKTKSRRSRQHTNKGGPSRGGGEINRPPEREIGNGAVAL